MKLVLQRSELLNPLQRVIGAIEKRQTMPMLANVLIESGPQGIALTATDLEITLKASLPFERLEPGKAAVPARKLFDICKALPDHVELMLDAGNERATLKAGSSRFSLACLPADDFPAQEESAHTARILLPAVTLRELLDKTAFAMANQDVRYYLNGLMLEVFDNGLRAVATDGHRLSYSTAEIMTGAVSPMQVIVPRKGVLELQRLVNDEEKEVSLILGSKHLKVESTSGEFLSKLIDGRFPDYKRVMPDNPGNHLLVDRLAFKDALHRAAILSNEKYRGIRLVMENDQLTLQTHNSEQEEAEEQIAVDYQGSRLEIGFNVQYLLDVTNVLGSEQLRLSLKDSNSSALIDNPEDGRAKYVVMPMRL